MFTKLTRRVLTGTVAAAGLTAVLAAPASAADANSAQTNAPSAIACRNVPGHYCAKVNFTSVRGGIVANTFNSTGYTTARGSGAEYVVYTCNAGLCGIRPTPVLNWPGRDVKLVAKHTNVGLKLVCGAQFGVAWYKPGAFPVKAAGSPGNGRFQWKVTCNGTQQGVLQAVNSTASVR